MPLSDHERRLLAEMEQALSAEDPKLASTFSAGPASQIRKGAALGIVLILLGLAGLFAGLFTQMPLVGVIGFVIALAGTVTIIPNFYFHANYLPMETKNSSLLSVPFIWANKNSMASVSLMSFK